jgi:hypothetical protein
LADSEKQVQMFEFIENDESQSASHQRNDTTLESKERAEVAMK